MATAASATTARRDGADIAALNGGWALVIVVRSTERSGFISVAIGLS